MLVTKTVSELTNYNKVLSEVDSGNEVLLTKNGKGKYVVLDAEDWQYMNAMLRFMKDMHDAQREQSHGGKWYTADEVRTELGLAINSDESA